MVNERIYDSGHRPVARQGQVLGPGYQWRVRAELLVEWSTLHLLIAMLVVQMPSNDAAHYADRLESV